MYLVINKWAAWCGVGPRSLEQLKVGQRGQELETRAERHRHQGVRGQAWCMEHIHGHCTRVYNVRAQMHKEQPGLEQTRVWTFLA